MQKLATLFLICNSFFAQKLFGAIFLTSILISMSRNHNSNLCMIITIYQYFTTACGTLYFVHFYQNYGNVNSLVKKGVWIFTNTIF